MGSERNSVRQQEQEAVRTTIVGGRPPGCGKSVGQVPRGIEVLVKKAAVDAEFRDLLLSKRAAAAKSIGLELSPAESMMLSAVPAAQLQSIIAATTVPPTHVPAFLGKVAAVMLVALGVIQGGCNKEQTQTVRPEDANSPKDNIAATTRPAAPNSDQPITIAGAVYVKPMTRPAEAQPAGVAGIMPDHPVQRVAGLIADPPRDEPITVLGQRATRPATEPAQDVLPDRPQNIRVPKPVFGGQPNYRREPSTTQPSQPEPVIFGMMIDRPQDTVIRGLRVDTPRPATSQPAAENPETRPAPENITVYGIMPDRPAAIRGIRIDRPPAAESTTQPASQPSAEQSDNASVPENVTLLGIMPDRPAVIKGILADRPATTQHTTQPTTQPATEPANTEPDFNTKIVDGIRPDRPKRED